MTSRGFYSRIQRMLMQRKIIKYLIKYPYKSGFDIETMKNIKLYGADRNTFISYVMRAKRYRYPLILRVPWKFRKWKGQQTRVGSAYWSKIADCVDDCVADGYIINKRGEEYYEKYDTFITVDNVKVTRKGRRFIKWPKFIDTVLANYTNITTLFIGLGGGSLLGVGGYWLYNLIF